MKVLGWQAPVEVEEVKAAGATHVLSARGKGEALIEIT